MDAEQVFAHPEYPPLMDLKLHQVGFADMLILNKVDIAGPVQVAKVKGWLDDHFNRLRIVESNYCDVPLEIVLSVGRFDPARSSLDREHAHDHDHTNSFSTWSYETDRPLSLEALREAVRKLPGNIYRAKGVIYSSDAPQQPAVLQVVGRRVDISLQDKWGRRTPRTQIVAIGGAGGIDASLLENTFASCISVAAA